MIFGVKVSKTVSSRRNKNKALRAENPLGNIHNIEQKDKGNIFKRTGIFLLDYGIYIGMTIVIIIFVGAIVYAKFS
jgi:hypothetical protein